MHYHIISVYNKFLHTFLPYIMTATSLHHALYHIKLKVKRYQIRYHDVIET